MATLAEHVGAARDANWTFAVAEASGVQALSAAIGFWYEWDETSQQFDHPAMVAGIRDGRLRRLLVGGSIGSRRLDELVRELSGEFVASYPLPGRVRFRCLRYDASSGQVTLDWGFGLLLVPVAGAALTTLMMFVAGAALRRRAGAVSL